MTENIRYEFTDPTEVHIKIDGEIVYADVPDGDVVELQIWHPGSSD